MTSNICDGFNSGFIKVLLNLWVILADPIHSILHELLLVGLRQGLWQRETSQSGEGLQSRSIKILKHRIIVAKPVDGILNSLLLGLSGHHAWREILTSKICHCLNSGLIKMQVNVRAVIADPIHGILHILLLVGLRQVLWQRETSQSRESFHSGVIKTSKLWVVVAQPVDGILHSLLLWGTAHNTWWKSLASQVCDRLKCGLIKVLVMAWVVSTDPVNCGFNGLFLLFICSWTVRHSDTSHLFQCIHGGFTHISKNGIIVA